MEQTLGRVTELQLANPQLLREVLRASNEWERRTKAFMRGSRKGGKEE